ncbi:hypothetical protein ACLB2K_040714 [Fragaria x ananassa]
MVTATFCYRALLLVLFFVGFLALTTAVSVLIRNKLPDGLELNVHCQSGDDDLGEHVIPNKESYDWSFTTGPFSRVHVTVENDLGMLGSDHLVLKAHCRSKDDDLGVRNLPPHASFKFSFRPHVIFKTVFTCDFDWPNNVHHQFDIYNYDRDDCRNCSWIITPNTPCMHNFDRQNVKCHPWKK